jgi:single stranded DNA-binding protein (ssb)
MTNQIILHGRFVRDGELKENNGLLTTKNCIAVQRDYKDKRTNSYESDFFEVTGYGKIAEVMTKYAQKGKEVVIVGRLQNNNYTNKEGKKVYKNDIVVLSLDLCTFKDNSNTKTVSSDEDESVVKKNVEEFDDSDLPF